MMHLEVEGTQQLLKVYKDKLLYKTYAISTAKKGFGEINGSEQTPRGWHCIRAKIGGGCPLNAVFTARRFSGEIFDKVLAEQNPGRDWILTRILWLSGLEAGKNRLGKVDTMRRFIYIHGTADEQQLGKPLSHGCIRMKNTDVLELFNLVPVATKILINE